MNQSTLSKWMKAIIIMFAVCGGIIFGFVLPYATVQILNSFKEYQNFIISWLIFSLTTTIPCYAVLLIAWKIATSIANNKAFTKDNSQRLKKVSILAFVSSIYLFIGNIIFFILNANPVAWFAALLLVCFIGVSISVASAVLSYFVNKAAILKEENDLTI